MHTLETGDLAGAPISVVRAPQLSVMQWLMDASSGVGPRSPLMTAVRARVGARATLVTSTLGTLGTPGLGYLPDSSTPIRPLHDTTVHEQVAHLLDSSGAELATELRCMWGDTPPPVWQPVAHDPKRWLTELGHACDLAWIEGAPAWERAKPALERETARAGLAAVTQSMDAFLNSLHPQLVFTAGRLMLRGACDSSFALAGRRLVLIPLLAGSRRLMVDFESPDLAYVAYPVPGISRRDDELGPMGKRTGAALALILGPVRASLLRDLAHPRTMSDIARRVHCAPSTATYHCDQLEQAQLLYRERRRQSVWVRRTRRGDELVALLEDVGVKAS